MSLQCLECSRRKEKLERFCDGMGELNEVVIHLVCGKVRQQESPKMTMVAGC